MQSRFILHFRRIGRDCRPNRGGEAYGDEIQVIAQNERVCTAYNYDDGPG